jgi:hypothetical protein
MASSKNFLASQDSPFQLLKFEKLASQSQENLIFNLVFLFLILYLGLQPQFSSYQIYFVV